MELTNINEIARTKIVGTIDKCGIERKAVAKGCVYMNKETLMRISQGEITLIAGCNLSFELNFNKSRVDIFAYAKNSNNIEKTDMEMEALTAVSLAALNIYDMCKAVDMDMIISEIMIDRGRLTCFGTN